MPPSRGVKKPKEDKSDHRVVGNRYRVEKKLGSGNFGTAFLVYDLKANTEKGDEELKVMKEISVGDLAPDETVDAVREAKLLSKLNHPGIVKFFDSFLDGEYFCIITEYCEGGDLDDKISSTKKSGKHFDLKTVMDWFVQLVLAVQHMHSRRVLHRDLKTRNIFLKKNMIKIGDFGISRVLMGTTDMASTFTGTPYYMSPEVLKHEGYNSKSDVWSIACILYELCALEHAFEGQSLMGVMYKIVEGKLPQVPDRYDKNIQQILNTVLNKDPSKRPSANEVTKVPFVARHIEKMKNRIQQDNMAAADQEVVTSDTQELAAMVREKTYLSDLQTMDTYQKAQLEVERELEDSGVGEEADQLTPTERLRLKKMKAADEKAKMLLQHTRANLAENMMRKMELKGTMGSYNRPAWQGGTGESLTARQLASQSYYGQHPPDDYSGAVMYEREDLGTVREYGGEGGGVAYYEREDLGTVMAADPRAVHYAATYTGGGQGGLVHRGDRPIQPMKSQQSYEEQALYQQYLQTLELEEEEAENTLRVNPGHAHDDRPITPLKAKVNLDDPNITQAVPPGLKPSKKQLEQRQQGKVAKTAPAKKAPAHKPAQKPPPAQKAPAQKSPAQKKPVKAVPAQKTEIPVDADAAETFYAQHDEFEPDSDEDNDYNALINHMQDALDKTSSDQNATIKDDTIVDAFSPTVRNNKIKNMRAQCEAKLGEKSFRNVYSYLKQVRFGTAGPSIDENEIMKGLKKFMKNPSDAFLVDQLLFLEEQANYMK